MGGGALGDIRVDACVLFRVGESRIATIVAQHDSTMGLHQCLPDSAVPRAVTAWKRQHQTHERLSTCGIVVLHARIQAVNGRGGDPQRRELRERTSSSGEMHKGNKPTHRRGATRAKTIAPQPTTVCSVAGGCCNLVT